MRWKPGRLVGAALLAAAVAAFGAEPACECDSACVAVPTTVKTTTWAYNGHSREKCYLLPTCPLLTWLFHSDPGPHCSHPVPRTVVIKRRMTCERPAWKCEPPGP